MDESGAVYKQPVKQVKTIVNRQWNWDEGIPSHHKTCEDHKRRFGAFFNDFVCKVPLSSLYFRYSETSEICFKAVFPNSDRFSQR